MEAAQSPATTIIPVRLQSDSSSDDSEDEGSSRSRPRGAAAEPDARVSSLRRKWGTPDMRGSALSILNAVAAEEEESDEEAAEVTAKVSDGHKSVSNPLSAKRSSSLLFAHTGARVAFSAASSRDGAA